MLICGEKLKVKSSEKGEVRGSVEGGRGVRQVLLSSAMLLFSYDLLLFLATNTPFEKVFSCDVLHPNAQLFCFCDRILSCGLSATTYVVYDTCKAWSKTSAKINQFDLWSKNKIKTKHPWPFTPPLIPSSPATDLNMIARDFTVINYL